MRVGLVIYGGLETLSGGFLYDRKLVEYLQSQGDTVDIIALSWRSYARHLLDNWSVELAQRLANLPVDVLLQDELNHPSLFHLNRSRRWPYPIISIVHHLRSSEDHPGWLKPLYARVEAAYLRSVDGFIFNSYTTRREVAALVANPRGVVATPGGNAYQVHISRDQIIERAHLPGPLQLVFVGNLIPRKNIHCILRAMARLLPGRVELAIVGDPSIDPGYTRFLHREVQRLHLGEQVHFMGRLPNPQVRKLLCCSHVLVAPSTYEGFGIVYLEGFQFGLPAVGSRRGAAAEVITPGESGILIDPGDDAALAQIFDELSQDRAALVRLSLGAVARFRQFPTWAETGQKIRTFLLESIQPQPG